MAIDDRRSRDGGAERIEWLKCRRSVVYFVVAYVWIYNATTTEWLRFALWPAQEQTLRQLAQSAKVLVLKARQLGLSWLVLAYCLHVALFRSPATVLLFSKRDKEAKELLGRVKGMYARLPAWMQARAVLKSNESEFVLSTGSRFLAFPTTGGRSYTGTIAVVDECDFVPDLGGFLNAVKPTIDAGGQLFLITTSDKKRPLSTFKRLYRAALRQAQRRHSKELGDYVPVFLPWYARPDRELRGMTTQRAEMFAQKGSDDDLHAEYPETPEQALAPESLDRRLAFAWIEAIYAEQAPLGRARRAGCARAGRVSGA